MKRYLFLLLFAGPATFSQTSTGFLSVTRFDESRPSIAEQKQSHGRIIQINIWYPSTAKGKKMTFGEYVALAGSELDSSSLDAYNTGINRYFAWPASVNADKNKFIAFLERKASMNAVKDAPLPVDKYPLVMLVHGYAADYAYLAENIAKNGFVVMHIPVKGTSKYELDYEGKGLESQVLDYEFGLNILKNEFPIIKDEIAVAGFSFGGQSAMALAIRNRSVKSVLSFDGGIGSAFGGHLLASQSWYDPSKINQPILHLYNARDQYTDLSWLKALTGTRRFLVSMKNMEHGHFTSFGMLNKVLPGIMGRDAPDPGRGYEGLVLLATSFINTTLKRHAIPGKNFIAMEIKKNSWLKNTISGEECFG